MAADGTHPAGAQDLAAGSRLRTEDGSRATVRSVRSFTGARDMYDLGIEGVHAYFVQAGSVAVLAHNAGSCWVDLTGPGVWTAINEIMSAMSAAYEFRMTGGVPRNIGYVLDNVKFDGYRAGVLTFPGGTCTHPAWPFRWGAARLPTCSDAVADRPRATWSTCSIQPTAPTWSPSSSNAPGSTTVQDRNRMALAVLRVAEPLPAVMM
ncbi:hypothetical protein GCM10009827_058700 [Dactylosporangium maewongense]|uniref:Intein C-terminal splicing domain-containing protein n=1 Tax=Dactylosporangium maewongense TaxID=634393 RepID=A0ABN2B361_9ACTN